MAHRTHRTVTTVTVINLPPQDNQANAVILRPKDATAASETAVGSAATNTARGCTRNSGRGRGRLPRGGIGQILRRVSRGGERGGGRGRGSRNASKQDASAGGTLTKYNAIQI